MYNDCSSTTSFPLIDTSNGTNFSNMFYGCSSATSFPRIDTSNGTNFSGMYSNCSSATEFPALNTSNGTNFIGMYGSCSSATEFPALDTSNGTDFSGMYRYCSKVTKIDISKLSSSTTSTTSQMLYCCYSLKALIIRSFGESYVLNSNALGACYHILGTKNTGYNPEGLKDGYIYVPRDMIETLSNATT
jgi:hypothetical protein